MLLTFDLRYANIKTKGGEMLPNTEKIKSRMKELGYTQTDLAKQMGMATPTICQKINNIRPFSLDEAEQIASILKIKDKDFGLYFFTC